jgi:hypothetical protein
MTPTQPQDEPARAIPARRHPNHGRPRPRPMTLNEIARAFVYYQTHTQRETAAVFGVAQSTLGDAFRRVFGPDAVRDAEATWRIKRKRLAG